jgi:plasmid replication initiation protein
LDSNYRERLLTMPEEDQLPLPLDSPLIGRIKNDRTMMVWNFFSLTKDRITNLPKYDDGKVKIEVKATDEGVATIWDKDILIYVASLLRDKMNRGEACGRRITFTAHDFFRVCRIHASGASYDRLEGALKRLKATTITTNIETGGEGTDGGFSWVTEYKINYRRTKDGEKALKSVTLELCEWLYRALERHNTILTYDPAYFDLLPLEKRLYEIARAHCGEQGQWKINIEKLCLRVGSHGDLRKFKHRLVQMSKRKNALPEYAIFVVDPKRYARDLKDPPAAGRVSVKQYMVWFVRSDRLSKMSFAEAPEFDDLGAVVN